MSYGEERIKLSEGLKFLRLEGDDNVYEVRRVDLKNGAFVTERKITIEAAYERVVWVSHWKETARYECFCCTCYDGTDAACRNHGYYGKRPCDIHNLPGYIWEGTDEMPESVLTIRRKQAEQ